MSTSVQIRSRHLLWLVLASEIEGLILNSDGERFSSIGPAEGLGHGCVEVGDEALDVGAQVLFGGEVAAAKEFLHQDGEPDFDLVEP